MADMIVQVGRNGAPLFFFGEGQLRGHSLEPLLVFPDFIFRLLALADIFNH